VRCYLEVTPPRIHLEPSRTENLDRIDEWIAEKPLAPTRQSAFVRMMTATA